MAIKIETFTEDGVQFNRVFSDEGRYVVRDGVAYVEACDLTSAGRTYTEGDFIEDNAQEEITNEEAFTILFGGAE